MVALAPPERRHISKARVFFALLGLAGMVGFVVGVATFFFFHYPADQASAISGSGGLAGPPYFLFLKFISSPPSF